MSKLLKFKKKEKENDGKEILVPSTFNKMLDKANEIKTVSFDFNVKDASTKNIRFNEQMMVDFVPI